MNPQNDETPDSQSIHPTQPASPPTPFSPVINSSPTSPVMPPSAPMKPKGGRKKILLIVVGAVIAVLGIGSYTAYALWYNNPGKVSDDAFRSVLTAKSANYTGKIEFAPAKGTGSGATTIEFNGQGDQNNSQINLKVDINVAPISIKLGTSLISSKAGDLYFKIDNAKDILNTFGSFIGGDVASTPILKTINDKLDNKWVKLTAADLKELNTSGNDQQGICLQKAVTDFQNNKSQQNQLFKAFNDNRFVKVDKQLGSAKIGDSTSNGYQLGFDEKKAESFGKVAEQIDVTRALKNCLGDSNPISNQPTPTGTTTIEVWADQWSHQLTRLKVEVDGHESGVMTLTFDPQLNKPANVQIPTTGITPFTDLKKDFEALYPTDSLLQTSNLSSDLTSLEN